MAMCLKSKLGAGDAWMSNMIWICFIISISDSWTFKLHFRCLFFVFIIKGYGLHKLIVYMSFFFSNLSSFPFKGVESLRRNFIFHVFVCFTDSPPFIFDDPFRQSCTAPGLGFDDLWHGPSHDVTQMSKISTWRIILLSYWLVALCVII